MDAARDEVRLLADPTRARIVGLILAADNGRQTVTRLADELALRQPTVSHHVKALADAGLLTRIADGRRAWYSVPPARVDAVTALLPRTGVDAPGSIDRVAADLTQRFAGTFGAETVDRYVRETAGLLRARGVERHLASRTASFAADRLAALARAESTGGARSGRSGAARPEVLFVCVQNAGRSQLAAAIMRQLAGDRVVVRTAGSDPADDVRGAIISALDEIGVPLGAEYPKPLTDEVVRAADVVVTMGCGDACPVYPGKRYLDWPIEDPVGLPAAAVRGIRDDIEGRVRELLASLM